jgi:HEAT repeat protein
MRTLSSLALLGCLLYPAQNGWAAAAEPDLGLLLNSVAGYQSGQSMQAIRQIEALVRQSAPDQQLRERLELGLVSLLSTNATAEGRQFATQQLITIVSDKSLPILAKLLNQEDTVALACQVLANHPSPQASSILRDALGKTPSGSLVPIISTLGERRDEAAVPLLIRLSADTNASIAAAAVLALGNIGSAPARDAITQLRHDRPAHIAAALVEASMQAAEKLAAAGDKMAAQDIYEDLLQPAEPDNVRRGSFHALLELDEDGGEERILKTLRTGDALLKPVAISRVRSLRSAEASQKFGRALATLPPQEQVWLLEILAERQDNASQAAVRTSLGSTNAQVRFATIAVLGKGAGSEAVGPLTKALERAITPREQAAIERALSSLRGEDLEQALTETLSAAPEPSQNILIKVLARRGSRASVSALQTLAKKPATAEAAFQALGALAEPDDLPTLLNLLLTLAVPAARSDAENAVARCLAKVPDPEKRADALSPTLATATDMETRSSLLRLLPTCAAPRALEALRQSLSDPSPAIRETAVRAFSDWPDMGAWEPLLRLYTQSTSASVAALSWNGLVRLAEEQNERPDSALIRRYSELINKARTGDDTRRVLGALSGAAHPDSLQLAVSLLSRPAVRAEAELAVKRLADQLKAEHPEAVSEALRSLR